jgi:enterochelin esterase family protein
MTSVLASPRLAALQQALEAGNAKALDVFWHQVVEVGTPLIETMEGDDDHCLVTFLWHAEEEIENVVVISLLMDWTNNQMTRLLDTDLWYRTCRVRNDVRVTYQLAPNDPATPLGVGEVEDREARTANWQPDPLNPRVYVFPKDEELESPEFVRSVIELPAAPAQPWIQPRDGVPTGKVEFHRLRSDILDNERRVWVYTPPGYTTDGEPYGLLILFDGWAYVELIPTPTILDNLLSEDLIPSLVAVFPDSLDVATRLRELLLHPPFNDFLAEELLPWMRERYHVTHDPAQTIVGGSSAGGLAAAFAGLQYPEHFGNILSQSGAFRWGQDGEDEWLARQFAVKEKLPLHFYLDAGVLEVNSLLALGASPNLVVANRHMRNVLQAKGYPVHYAEFSGGHDYLCWQGTLAEGLLALIGRVAA